MLQWLIGKKLVGLTGPAAQLGTVINGQTTADTRIKQRETGKRGRRRPMNNDPMVGPATPTGQWMTKAGNHTPANGQVAMKKSGHKGTQHPQKARGTNTD